MHCHLRQTKMYLVILLTAKCLRKLWLWQGYQHTTNNLIFVLNCPTFLELLLFPKGLSNGDFLDCRSTTSYSLDALSAIQPSLKDSQQHIILFIIYETVLTVITQLYGGREDRLGISLQTVYVGPNKIFPFQDFMPMFYSLLIIRICIINIQDSSTN